MDKNKAEHYQSALIYWSKIPPTVDGVLGGFGHISDVDIGGSQHFLKYLFEYCNISNKRALDCGAGIGRVSKFLLLPNFEAVDVVEPDTKFLNYMEEFVGKEAHRVENKFNCILQDLELNQKYDIIWNQWVLGHLDDEDLVKYFKTCSAALSENGVIVVKENVTSSGITESDAADSSVTRSLKELINIFKRAKLKRIRQCRQTNFPDEIYPVYMFALVHNKDDI